MKHHEWKCCGCGKHELESRMLLVKTHDGSSIKMDDPDWVCLDCLDAPDVLFAVYCSSCWYLVGDTHPRTHACPTEGPDCQDGVHVPGCRQYMDPDLGVATPSEREEGARWLDSQLDALATAEQPPLPASFADTVMEMIKGRARRKTMTTEFFLLAFLEETGLRPSEVEMVERIDGLEMSIYFRKKGSKDGR